MLLFEARLNQCCSETPLKILFQQYGPEAAQSTEATGLAMSGLLPKMG